MSNCAIITIENIAIYIIVATLFVVTRSPWSFVFLLFVNFRRRVGISPPADHRR